MFSKLLGLSISTAIVASSVSQAAAGGYPVECYERYRTQPVYDTVHENVQVHPGYTDVQVSPAIYGTRNRTVLASPERVEYRVIPAQYGYEKERVMIEPARTVARRTAPIYEMRYRKVKVSDGGYSWEWRVINGRRVLCKIKHKAEWGNVAERVLVSHGHVVHETVPAVWGYQKRKVLIAPERSTSYVVPARYETVTEQVVVQPKQVRKTYVAPSYQTRSRTVMVKPGREGWNRVAIPKHCKY